VGISLVLLLFDRNVFLNWTRRSRTLHLKASLTWNMKLQTLMHCLISLIQKQVTEVVFFQAPMCMG